MGLVPRWKLPLWLRITWTVALGVLASLVAVAQTLHRTLKPETWAWIHTPKVQVGLVGALAVLTLVDTTYRTYVRLRFPKVDRQSKELRNQLASLIVTVADITQQPISHLGCGLFLVQKRGVLRPERLIRVERVRLIDDLHESDVEFTIGKGTVGECWRNGRKASKDWTAINERYCDDPLDEEQWARLSEKIKRGFTLSEFRSLVGKYAEVLAMPITIEGKFVGCIAVDLKWHKGDRSGRRLLDRSNVTTPVGGTTRTVVPVLKR